MKRLWLIGYGGIGQALCRKFLKQGYEISVFSSQHSFKQDVSYQQIDVTKEKEVFEAVNHFKTLPDLIINTCGLLHDSSHQPEKTIMQLSDDWLQKSMEVNVLSSIWFCKAIHASLSLQTRLTFCSFSARVSSISDNRLGGWYSYRMSKAMLNMFIKNASLEWKIKSPHSLIYGYHPGTVDTALSKPFQSRVNHLFTPDEAADFFYQVFCQVDLSVSGQLLDWKGDIISP